GISNGPTFYTCMLRHQLDRVIYILCLQQEYSSDNFLGLGKRAIENPYFPVFPAQSLCGLRVLQWLSAGKMSVLSQDIIVGQTFVYDRVLLAFTQRFKPVRFHISKTHEFHRCSPITTSASAVSVCQLEGPCHSMISPGLVVSARAYEIQFPSKA